MALECENGEDSSIFRQKMAYYSPFLLFNSPCGGSLMKVMAFICRSTGLLYADTLQHCATSRTVELEITYGGDLPIFGRKIVKYPPFVLSSSPCGGAWVSIMGLLYRPADLLALKLV